MKIKKWQIGVITLAVVLIVGSVVAGILLSAEKMMPGTDYSHDSSLRWYETVEGIVLDGKMEDAAWENITPYSKTTNKANRAEKYEAMEARITECNAKVYTVFGEGGLFIYARTDDQIINTGVVSPLSKSAFEFYLCSQEKLTKYGNIFEFTISADNCLKLRVRDFHPETGKEAWISVPCVGVKSKAVLNDQGYTVECFIPWQTLNMEQKPEKLQLATALIRVLDPEDTADFLWECFDYYSASVALNNSATFPVFDENGYIPRESGVNFYAPNSNILDLSADRGNDPYVTALNRSPVTAFMQQEPMKDVYWETTLTIKDFNHNDDPRVGILLRGEPREDGSYDQVYLMLELDKNFQGEGYEILHALMLPSSSAANNWKDAQRYVLGSHIENDSFKLAIMKHNGVFYFLIDDVLVASRDAVESFGADTKVSCGITSWYTGAVFSNYSVVTENLNDVLKDKQDTFVTDEKKWKLYFDLFNQDKGVLTTDETDAWMYHSIVNWNGINAGRFYAEADIEIKGSNVDGNGYAGFVLTAGDNRLYILLSGTQKGVQYLEYHSMTKENFKSTGKDRKVCETWDTVKLGAKNKLAIYRDGNVLTVLLNGKVMERIQLNALTYPIRGNVQVGLTGWKVKANFKNYSIKTGSAFSAPSYDKDSASMTHASFDMALSKSASKDLYAEATVKVSDVLSGEHPRAGLRLTNKNGQNLDFVAYYDQNKKIQNWIMVVPTDAEGNDAGTKQYYGIDSAIGDVSESGIKLAAAKKGGLLYFYVNDVLLGTKEYSGFSEADEVSASLYSKYAETNFSEYFVNANPVEAMASLNNDWIADENRDSDCFDVLAYADGQKPQISINETCSYVESSVIHRNGVYSDKIFVETKITLNNTGNAYAGVLLTDAEGNRFYIMTYGTAAGITYMEYITVPGDVFDSRTSEYDKISVVGGNSCKLSVYKDGGELLVFVDDALVKTLALPASLAGQTKVGFGAWKGANAIYTEYRVLAGEEFPEIQEPEFEGDASYVKNEKHVYALHETAYKSLKARTTLAVKEVQSGVFPRVGLRLTNGAGRTLDFVIAYNKDTAFWANGFYIVTVDAENKETTKWVDLDAGILPDDRDVTLTVEKLEGTLNFYIGDTLVLTNTYEGFGEEDAVIAALYSRYTETVFTDYKAILPYETDITKGTDVYTVCNGHTGDFMAQTLLHVQTATTGVYSRVGLRLASDSQTWDCVLYFTNKGVLEPYILLVNQSEKKLYTEKITGVLLATQLPLNVKLDVKRVGGNLSICLNGVLLKDYYAPYDTVFPCFAEGEAVSVSLYSKLTDATFLDFEVNAITE